MWVSAFWKLNAHELFLVHLQRALLSSSLFQESGWLPFCLPPSRVWAICSTFWLVTGKRAQVSFVCLQPGKHLIEFSKDSQAVPAVTGSGARSVCKVQGQPHQLLVNTQTKTIDLSFHYDCARIFNFTTALRGAFISMFIAEKAETQQNILPKQAMADPGFRSQTLIFRVHLGNSLGCQTCPALQDSSHWATSRWMWLKKTGETESRSQGPRTAISAGGGDDLQY